METKGLRACKNCHLLTESEVCSTCLEETVEQWSGCVIVLNPARSQIAKRLNITRAGKYALKVKNK